MAGEDGELKIKHFNVIVNQILFKTPRTPRLQLLTINVTFVTLMMTE